MIDIGKLYCQGSSTGDGLRYGTRGTADRHGNRPHAMAKLASERRPIVVWNTTRTCNLKCVHCYTDSDNQRYPGELTTNEGKLLIDSLADFNVPSLLFSGGEPFMRKDLIELISYARDRGIRPVISTNGTLIDRETAGAVRAAGVTYVGISLDGIGEINDAFRGVAGAYERAMEGFRNCAEAGQRAGLRLTLTKRNYLDLEKIFDFIEEQGIQRACFYHLVYSGRGEGIFDDDLTCTESRHAMDIILKRTRDFHERGLDINILTVDNHADGVYLYLKLLEENSAKAGEARELLEWNGGAAHSTGVGIASIDFFGNVHPDQFWHDYDLGNIRDRAFGEIWMDTSDELMAVLKNKTAHLKGRCRLCAHRALCNGAMRVRAWRVYGDYGAPDPQCYLTDDEIGLTDEIKKELAAMKENYPVPPALRG